MLKQHIHAYCICYNACGSPDYQLKCSDIAKYELLLSMSNHHDEEEQRPYIMVQCCHRLVIGHRKEAKAFLQHLHTHCSCLESQVVINIGPKVQA